MKIVRMSMCRGQKNGLARVLGRLGLEEYAVRGVKTPGRVWVTRDTNGGWHGSGARVERGSLDAMIDSWLNDEGETRPLHLLMNEEIVEVTQ